MVRALVARLSVVPRLAVRRLVIRFLVLSVVASALPAGAQEPPPPLRLEADGAAGELVLRLGDLLADPSLQEALESGFPLRVEVVAELWRDGFFDSQQGQVRWRASMVHDPLAEIFVLEMEEPEEGAGGPAVLRETFPDMASLRAAFPRRLRTGLAPREEGRFYYLGRLSVETLSLTDLEELRRWLRGELAPAISGDGDVDNAVERGLRRAMIRLLGMPTRRFDARSPGFEVSDGGAEP